MSTVTTTSADVFACYSKACAPPPVGKGGSGSGRSGGQRSIGPYVRATGGNLGGKVAMRDAARRGEALMNGKVSDRDRSEFLGLGNGRLTYLVARGNGASHSKAMREATGKGLVAQVISRRAMSQVSKSAASALKDPDGGFTIKASNGEAYTSGFAVALKGSDRLMKASDMFGPDGKPTKEFEALVQDRLSALQNESRLPKGVGLALGGWHNPDDGKIEINTSVVFPPTRQADATKFAQSNDQISMARLHDPFEIIPTGGTGGDRS